MEPVNPDSTASEPTDARRKPAFMLHAICFSVIALCWLIDSQTYVKAKNFYFGAAPINGELHQLIISMAMYGQALGIVCSILLILVFDVKRRGRAVILGAVLLSVGLCSSSLKAVCGRLRPLEADGATVFQGLHHGLRGSRNHSFPSGHTATAFAMSYTLAKFYPPARPVVWALAGGVAANRVITLRHFPSDVVGGAWLGLIVAAMVYRFRRVRRLASIVSYWLTPSQKRKIMPRLPQYSTDQIWNAFANPWSMMLISLAIHWSGNIDIPLWDRDEPRFATATREMMARGDYVVPTFNGELRPDKPILVYWLMAAAYSLLGDSTFSARFFSGIAGSLACGVVFLMGRSMFDRRVGIIAGWMLALSPMLIVESKLATVDAILLLCLTTAFACLWQLYSDTGGWKTAAMFWSALGLGILAKGPVALAVVGGSIFALVAFQRQYVWLNRLRWRWGVALMAAIALPWCIAVWIATEGKLLQVAIGHHVIRRSMMPLENHSGFLGYYLVSLLGLMAPWAWLLPFTIREHWQRIWSDSRVTFLAAWAVATLLLFELVKTKLVHYYLPAYPALALLISSALIGVIDGKTIGLERLNYRFLGNLLTGAGCIGGVAAIIACVIFLPHEIAFAAVIVVALFAIGSGLAGWALREQQFKHAFATIICTHAAAMTLVGAELLPRIGKHRVIVRVAEKLNESIGVQAVALWNYRDPSLIYNTGKMLPYVDFGKTQPMFSDSLALALKHGSFLCPMTPDQLAQVANDPTLTTSIVDDVTTWDITRFRERTVHIVEVTPSENVTDVAAFREFVRRNAPNATRLIINLDEDQVAPSGDSRILYKDEPAVLSATPMRLLK